MLRLFGPDCSPAPVDVAKPGAAVESAIWIDLLEPTKEEEKLAERLIGQNIPTRAEMLEIEPSSRLYERDGATFMTLSVLYGVHDKKPASDPVTFILTDKHLVTVRYVNPLPFVAFAEQAYAEPQVAKDPLGVLIRLADAIIDRLADELEVSGREQEAISEHIFERRERSRQRSPERHYEALMIRIGEAQRILTKIRETSVSASRMLGFLAATDRVPIDSLAARHFKSLIADARAINDHSDFVAENLNFLLDASLGMINLQQNFVMKIFSVVAVVLMPPTLIAGIYGMNFKHMPELQWLGGYPWSIALMLASAILPYWFARRRGWL